MGAAAAVIALVASTALVVWVAGKPENPAQKLGKVMGWIGIVVAILLLIAQLYTCISLCKGGGCPMMRGGMMGQGMGQGMMMHKMMGPGAGPMGAGPAPAPEQK